MKKILAMAFLAAVMTITGCKKDEGDNNKVNPCSTPGLALNPQEGKVGMYINSNTGQHGFYEIEYGSNGFSKGSGTTVTMSGSYEINGLTNGTYDIYVRGNCGGTSWSDWSSPQSFLISGGSSSTCSKPNNLESSFYFLAQDYTLGWSHNGNASYYELEYGPSGFALGTGTKKTLSSSSYSQGAFTQNTTYDYYVRANCGGSDYSPWEGPASFFADNNSNRCIAPLNVTVYLDGGTIDYSFDRNGEREHEIYVNRSASTAGGGTLLQVPSDRSEGSFSGIYSGYTYYVFVRGICDGGGRTPWSVPASVYVN